MAHKKMSPATPASVDQGSGMLRSPKLFPGNTPSPIVLQARHLAVRFGFAPGIAELVAALAFQVGALQ